MKINNNFQYWYKERIEEQRLSVPLLRIISYVKIIS
jgi:hypothetical protein